MIDQPRPRRASYVLHIVSTRRINRQGMFRLDLAHMMDHVLEMFDDEPRFNTFTLDGQAALIEDYLTIRPENFERVEAAVQHGKLLLGPWYVDPEPSLGNVETTIRNLMIGLSTAATFGRPMRVGYMPNIVGLPAQLPQIFRSFGIESAILSRKGNDQPTEVIWEGIDGSRIVAGRAGVRRGLIPELRHKLAPYSQSGHLLILEDLPRDIREFLLDLPAVQVELHDSVFVSSPVAYTQALETYARGHELPVIASDPVRTEINDECEKLTRWIEPFSVWAEHDGQVEWFLPRPQRLIQSLWRDYLKRGVTDEINEITSKIQAFGFQQFGDDPIVESSESAFIILATKLPEDPDRGGMIVRGMNTTGNEMWITLTPWRDFAVVETVTMDELPTGGKLAPENGGAVRFKAGPHRILTFWFHD